MATKPKTWAQLMEEITDTFRKWRAHPKSRVTGTASITNTLPTRSRSKRYQNQEEREVQLRFETYTGRLGTRPVEIRLDVRRGETALENLQLIAVAVEMMRMADVRGVTDLLVLLYRQTQPVQVTQQAPPPPPSDRKIPAHYATLHIDPSAPLAVAEAAYRALARTAHPDAGGNHATMQKLNAAIAQVRKEKA